MRFDHTSPENIAKSSPKSPENLCLLSFRRIATLCATFPVCFIYLLLEVSFCCSYAAVALETLVLSRYIVSLIIRFCRLDCSGFVVVTDISNVCDGEKCTITGMNLKRHVWTC